MSDFALQESWNKQMILGVYRSESLLLCTNGWRQTMNVYDRLIRRSSLGCKFVEALTIFATVLLSLAYGQSRQPLTRTELFRVDMACVGYISTHYEANHITNALSKMLSNAGGKGARSQPLNEVVNEARRRNNLGSLSQRPEMTMEEVGYHVLEAMCAARQK